MTIRLTLKGARVSSGLSLETVAERMGESVATVADWEAGNSEPSASKGVMLARLYGLRPELLY